MKEPETIQIRRIMKYTVEFQGTKGWEICLETHDTEKAVGKMLQLTSEGVPARVWAEFEEVEV